MRIEKLQLEISDRFLRASDFSREDLEELRSMLWLLGLLGCRNSRRLLNVESELPFDGECEDWDEVIFFIDTKGLSLICGL